MIWAPYRASSGSASLRPPKGGRSLQSRPTYPGCKLSYQYKIQEKKFELRKTNFEN